LGVVTTKWRVAFFKRRHANYAINCYSECVSRRGTTTAARTHQLESLLYTLGVTTQTRQLGKHALVAQAAQQRELHRLLERHGLV
jgi:hypothetical protein